MYKSVYKNLVKYLNIVEKGTDSWFILKSMMRMDYAQLSLKGDPLFLLSVQSWKSWMNGLAGEYKCYRVNKFVS